MNIFSKSRKMHTWIVTVLVLFLFAGISKTANANQQMIDEITKRIGNQEFHIHHDKVSRKTRLGIKTCKGNEFWSDGKITNVSVEPLSEMSARVTLRYNGEYRRKGFTGVGCEYRWEKRPVSGKYQFEVTFSLFGENYTNNHNLIEWHEVADRGHDSNGYTFEAIRRLVIDKFGKEK